MLAPPNKAPKAGAMLIILIDRKAAINIMKRLVPLIERIAPASDTFPSAKSFTTV